MPNDNSCPNVMPPGMTRVLLNLELPRNYLNSALGMLQRLLRMLEKVMRPRMTFLTDHITIRRLHGFCIFVCGMLLCLPLPVPFTNTNPDVTVGPFALSTLGKDGHFFLAAIAMFVVTIGFFGALGVGGLSAIKWASDSLGWEHE
jgi:hypothetical protein